MGATAMIFSTAMSVVGSIQQGQAAKKAANYNASIAERNAGIARQQAQLTPLRSTATPRAASVPCALHMGRAE
jgi:hypothetical protein